MYLSHLPNFGPVWSHTSRKSLVVLPILLLLVVKALCYKPEGRGFDPDEVKFPIYLILPAALGPGGYSASNRNEYQKQKNNVSGE
jgi:hypothetical protein